MKLVKYNWILMIAETRRLVLRKFINEDLKTFFKYRTDPQVFKYQSWNNKFTKEIAKIFIHEMKNINLETENEWMQIALETKSSKTHIGDCAIRRFDNGNQVEVGITIDRLYWKQGYDLTVIISNVNNGYSRSTNTIRCHHHFLRS